MDPKSQLLKTLIREEVRRQIRLKLNEAAPVYKVGERAYNKYDEKVRITHAFPNFAAAVAAYESDPKLASKMDDGPEYWEDDIDPQERNKPVYFVKGPGGSMTIVAEKWISVDLNRIRFRPN